MAIDYAALKSEIANDPSALGYKASTDTGSDQAVADALNLPRAGAPFAINREPIPVSVLFANIDPAEFLGLTALKLQQLQCVLAAGTIDVNDPRMQQIILAVLPGASKALLQAALKRTGSRAEALFGRGVIISVNDVSRALRGL